MRMPTYPTCLELGALEWDLKWRRPRSINMRASVQRRLTAQCLALVLGMRQFEDHMLWVHRRRPV